MHNQKVGSPRSTDSPRRLPDNDAAPLSPRTIMPRVLKKEYEELRLSVSKVDTLCQPVFDINSFIHTMNSVIAKECAKAGLPAKAEGLQAIAAQISSGLSQVENFYEKCDFANCHACLAAAKGNQVLLLAAIDALKQDPDGDDVFSRAHDHCAQLGHKIAALSLLVNEKSGQQQQQQQQAAPRSSSPRFVSSPDKHKNQKTKRPDAAPFHTGHSTPRSPEKAADSGRLEKLPSPTSGKRGQGDEDSPQFKNSPAKRHRKQMAEHTDPTLYQTGSDSTVHSPGPTDALSLPRMKPGSPSKLPKLDWSSAKPVNNGPHSPLSTTPRTQKQAHTGSKGNARQDAGNALTPLPTPAYDAKAVTGSEERSSHGPTSPPSVPSQANPDSPRKNLLSPSKPLKAQPRPRPPSMLFSSPPVPSGSADLTEKSAPKTRDNNSDVTTFQATPSAVNSTSTVTTPGTTDVAQRAQDKLDI
jgi:hypothetical protein